MWLYHLTSIPSCWDIGQNLWLFSKNVQFFSVFCVFLNEKWSMWHYLYIFVNLSKQATTFVKRTKQVAVFLGLWEFWPPKRKLVTVLWSLLFYFLMWSQNVTSCLLFWDICQTDCGNLLPLPEKIVITWRKLAIKSQKNTSKIKLMCILAMTLEWLCSGFRIHHKYRKN